ncbi:hypothetical protein ACFXJO_15800 [Streptomyces lavendulae]|uniref:hypothetical protein n=1 Tax=Streptomyces lavendulae TaxID=1914 RepID=UPI003678DEE2
MRKGPRIPAPHLLPIPLQAAAAIAAWAAWLGWDQHRDVHPDGSETGPYAAWQVIGLALTVLALTYRAASRGHRTAAVLGTTTGLTAAAYYDWSDDTSGLYMIGVTLLALTTLTTTTALTLAASKARTTPPENPHP